MKPQNINDVNLVFPADVSHLMPKYEDIPEKFENQKEWRKFVSKWFLEGIEDLNLIIPKNGIDKSKALRHLTAIIKSFQPKHEYKIAAISYLLSEWFELSPEFKDE